MTQNHPAQNKFLLSKPSAYPESLKLPLSLHSKATMPTSVRCSIRNSTKRDSRTTASVLLGVLPTQFAEGNHDQALLGYLKLSEIGYELAQTNAAWMLSRDHGLSAGESARGFVQPGARPLSLSHSRPA